MKIQADILHGEKSFISSDRHDAQRERRIKRPGAGGRADATGAPSKFIFDGDVAGRGAALTFDKGQSHMTTTASTPDESDDSTNLPSISPSPAARISARPRPGGEASSRLARAR